MKRHSLQWLRPLQHQHFSPRMPPLPYESRQEGGWWDGQVLTLSLPYEPQMRVRSSRLGKGPFLPTQLRAKRSQRLCGRLCRPALRRLAWRCAARCTQQFHLTGLQSSADNFKEIQSNGWGFSSSLNPCVQTSTSGFKQLIPNHAKCLQESSVSIENLKQFSTVPQIIWIKQREQSCGISSLKVWEWSISDICIQRTLPCICVVGIYYWEGTIANIKGILYTSERVFIIGKSHSSLVRNESKTASELLFSSSFNGSSFNQELIEQSQKVE